MNAQAQQDDNTFDNSKVIELTKARISKPIIIQSIEESSNYNYDISVKGLKQLSQSKVDEDIVILLMKSKMRRRIKALKLIISRLTKKTMDYLLMIIIKN